MFMQGDIVIQKSTHQKMMVIAERSDGKVITVRAINDCLEYGAFHPAELK